MESCGEIKVPSYNSYEIYMGGLDQGPSAFQWSDVIRLHTFMFDPLILKIVLFHKHSNDLFYFNIAPNIEKLESILCATPPRRN